MYFKQEWIKKYPDKRKRNAAGEIYANEYWAGHLVYRIFKQKVEKRKELDERRMLINRMKNASNKPINLMYGQRKQFVDASLV